MKKYCIIIGIIALYMLSVTFETQHETIAMCKLQLDTVLEEKREIQRQFADIWSGMR